MDDAKQFQVVKDAMDVVGFQSSEQDHIFQIIAGVLHLGQIEFKQEGHYAKVKNHEVVKIAAEVSQPIS